ncbi:MAG: hypothetical protein GSR80_000117 [Desulfurococcales archaeon]|nr:hypothetical protein [Desulfurococcales archaeon]
MPHPEVVEMRRRLARIHDLAEEAAERVGDRVVEELLDRWAEGRLSTRELVSTLKKLARGNRGSA